jgi:hypothetical protein
MTAHSQATTVHRPYTWEYDDQTEREAASGFVPADVGKLARQLDDNSLWMLTDDDPETWTQIGGASAIYPQDVWIPIHLFKIVTGGFTWSGTVSTAQQYNVEYFQNSPADGNAIQTTVLLKAGTYDVFVLGITANNRGIIDWSMDGSNFISGQDWYNGSDQYNIIKTGTVTIADDGRHLLKATVNGKNGSSSNYYMVITAIWLKAQSQSTET